MSQICANICKLVFLENYNVSNKKNPIKHSFNGEQDTGISNIITKLVSAVLSWINNLQKLFYKN